MPGLCIISYNEGAQSRHDLQSSDGIGTVFASWMFQKKEEEYQVERIEKGLAAS